MSVQGFVRMIAVLAAAATLLVAGFPIWDTSADAATSTVVARPDRHGQGGHDRGDKREKKKDNPGANANCSLIVPANPLSAEGLATPYQLVATDRNNGPCNEANADQAAFVEATILDSATGDVFVYRPLVVDKGTQPAADPAAVMLPANAVVGVWFGFQGDVLTLRGPGIDDGKCVNGLNDSPFGQFAYCNAPAFFAAAGNAMTAGNLVAPALGTGKDGQACPSVRDFTVVDQDQSDNVSTVYRVTADGRTAQDTAANAGIGAPLVNASDNGLLNRKIQPALGCTAFTAPDLTNGGATTAPSLALNELQAGQQAAPVALIPLNDPMAMVGDKQRLRKVNLYRAGVGQPAAASRADADGPTYCRNLMDNAPARIELDAPFTTPVTSPDPAMNLHDFLVQRYQASLTLLGCAA